MVYHRLPSSLLTVIALLSVTKSNGTPSKSAVRRPDADSKCHSYSTKYNYYYNSTLNTGSNKKMEALLHRVLDELREVREEIKLIKGNKTIVYKNCAELYKAGKRNSGVYSIDPDNTGAFDVYCDQKTAGGGWTVFQKRLDGSVDFYRGWEDYKRGFGNLNGEFWLGLDKIHRLTKERSRLRVDLEDTTGKTAYAEYDFFGVTSERSKYKLSLGTYSGTAGDSLSTHRGMAFSTKDRDNDRRSDASCAILCKGAWWYYSCVDSNLNGLYRHGKHSTLWKGVNWYQWKGDTYSAKRAEMKIKPVNA
ncbi:microfibril-associated glycoprotein 4-like [Porites lutea]|uniref:microfibril-associated glycoprotein 4-like n=1 Tax=Porites lutea TaxID=51062 RepID=UPI003CC50994